MLIQLKYINRSFGSTVSCLIGYSIRGLGVILDQKYQNERKIAVYRVTHKG